MIPVVINKPETKTTINFNNWLKAAVPHSLLLKVQNLLLKKLKVTETIKPKALEYKYQKLSHSVKEYKMKK